VRAYSNIRRRIIRIFDFPNGFVIISDTSAGRFPFQIAHAEDEHTSGPLGERDRSRKGYCVVCCART